MPGPVRFILDASVALSWCFPDEAGDYTNGVLALLTQSDAPAAAMAPAIWPLEVVNALLMGERKRRLTEAQTLQVIEYFESLDISVDEGGQERTFGVILSLAREYDLSSYDAAYLELAMRSGLPMATQDKKLAAAARRSGVKLLIPGG